jgi:predicted metal-dependent HD superfamily phosphohydrolase
MSALSPERWRALWLAAGASGDPGGWYERIYGLYAEPARGYHNLRHIDECLEEFDAARHLACQPTPVELALWFHDAIYDPRAHDNEERSAALATQALSEAGCGAALLRDVRDLIMATKHLHAPADGDAALLADIDLSILGKPQARFQDFELGVRQEYAWVAESIFRLKRAEILELFLARVRIYSTDWFFSRYERTARENLIASVLRLRSPGNPG